MSKITKKQADNVVALYEKLRSVKSTNFAFDSIAEQILDECDPFKCNTTACAWGWCPSIFPEQVKWERDYDNYFNVVDATNKDREIQEIGNELFGMDGPTFDGLFMNWNRIFYNGKATEKVTKQDVMRALKRYLDESGYQIV